MRIAIVTESFLPRTDGVVRSVLELLLYLRDHGHQALVFAAGPGPQEHLGFRVVPVGGLRFPLYPALTIAPYCHGMFRIMRDFRPDLVHLASPFVLGVQGRRAGAHLGVPVVAHFQTDVARYARSYGAGPLASVASAHMRRLHNRCQATYAPTISVARELEAQGYNNVRVSGRGVDTALFDPARRSAELRAGLLGPGEHTLLIYVGRLSSEKNLSLLSPLAATLPGVRLVLVGEGPHRGALEREFRGLPVTFAGLQHGEMLATYYASGDVFVFPSVTETFGQVVQEAMASGVPVLALRAGGVQDLFRDGEEGYLVPPGDLHRWTEAAGRLVNDATLRNRFAQRARASAETRTWRAIFDQLILEYRALAAARRPEAVRQSAGALAATQAAPVTREERDGQNPGHS